MNKFFLAVRIILLVALLFLLAAVFWGLAHHESTEAQEVTDIYEKYGASKPAGYTTVLLVVLVALGIFITLASIFFEYHQTKKVSSGLTARPVGDDKEGRPPNQ
jgi:TRAP-type C4-dicarboxylate transport system permease small subunit